MTPFQTLLNQCQTKARLIHSESETQNSPALKESLRTHFGSPTPESTLHQQSASEWVLTWVWPAVRQPYQLGPAQKEALFDDFCSDKLRLVKKTVGTAFFLISKSLDKGTMTIRIPFGSVDVAENLRRALQLSLTDVAVAIATDDGVTLVDGNQVQFKPGSTGEYIERVKLVIEAYGGVIEPASSSLPDHYSFAFVK